MKNGVSKVYTDRPDYADFDSPAKFEAIKSIIAKGLIEHPDAICSYSGGSDSDILLDLIERTRAMFELPPIKYVFFNTGLEMKATRDHVKYVAEKYGVEIEERRPEINIVRATRKYGIPFVSKIMSGGLSEWQKKGVPLSIADEYDQAQDKAAKRNGSGYYDPTAYMAMMNVRKEGENKMEVYRGDIFYVKSNRKDTVKETTGSPAVVVSNNKGNENSNFVEIVYLTADERNLIPTHVNIMCKVPSVALCERISNVSKDRLEEYIRSCTDDEMRRIDEALMLSLGVEVSGGNTTEEAEETINALKLELVETKKIGEELKRKLKEEVDKREAMKKAMNTYEKNTEDASDIVDGRIKAAAERDVYKELYMYLLDRAISA